MKKTAKSTPGSDAALNQGCMCPVMDNAHGKGRTIDGKVMLWMNDRCPLHGMERSNDEI